MNTRLPPETHSKRNKQILDDLHAGIPPREVAANHGISYSYTQKIHSESKRPELVRNYTHSTTSLYHGRDRGLMMRYMCIDQTVSARHIGDK